MTLLKSLPTNATLLDVFKTFPGSARHLISYHEVLLRGPSPFSLAERELIAAFVSGLNACAYCHGIHTVTAERFGISEGLLQALIHDVEAADIDPKFRPILRFVRKLSTLPAKILQADADAVYDAGWNEAALHDAVAICALFNFMNRYVEGLGISADATYFQLSGDRLHRGGYAGLLQQLPDR
ncbi:MAG: peroxidase-related enzyme [Micropepsaceae bacterium]